jgi:hypothetical protein
LSDFAWKLARLRLMTAGEVLHRARIALRDRLAPPAYELWTPPEACERLFTGSPESVLAGARLAAIAHVAPGEAGFAGSIDAARRLGEGRWSLFGREVRLDDPPLWNRNHRDGRDWPDLSSAKIDYRRGGAGDTKLTWELGRLTFLPTLALGARIERRADLAERCVRWLDDWNEENPLGHGIHHTSGIEMAVRVMTTSWTLALLGQRARGKGLAATLGLIGQQALHCRDHLSLGSSANNHLLSEYAAMAVAGGLFPSLRDSAALLERGVSGLEREVPIQIHEDGVPAEQAFGYLPFVWELVLCAFVVAEAAGRPIAQAPRERLRASLEFARALRLEDGRLPAIGDDDDARILLADEPASRLDLVGNALAAWLGAPALSGEDSMARLLFGRSGQAPAAAPNGKRTFDRGGYTAWRERGLVATFDHGPLGYPSIAAHGHADALAVTLQRDADAIVSDPGTFGYHADRAARDRCRSTPAHATVAFGGRSQSEMLGPFLWGRRASVTARDGGFECRWYTGERHWRRVEVSGPGMEIDDRVTGNDATLCFPLAPSARVEITERRATVRAGSTVATFDVEGAGPWHVADAEFSPRFGELQESQRLVAPIQSDRARTVITVRDRPSAVIGFSDSA